MRADAPATIAMFVQTAIIVVIHTLTAPATHTQILVLELVPVLSTEVEVELLVRKTKLKNMLAATTETIPPMTGKANMILSCFNAFHEALKSSFPVALLLLYWDGGGGSGGGRGTPEFAIVMLFSESEYGYAYLIGKTLLSLYSCVINYCFPSDI